MKDDSKDIKDKRHDLGKEAGLDFGTDADVVPPPESDPRFDAWIAKVAPTLNVPNAAPRAEMWDAIRAAQQQARDAQAGLIPGVTPLRRTWRLMSVIAAALLLGVAIDRIATRKREDTRVASVPAPTPAPKDSTTPSRLYRMAAAQTLTQAEALLVAYRAGDVPSRDRTAARQLGSWGREVLSSTRLLLDSPAGDDPQLRSLLDDLELVLVQIVQLTGAPLDTSERALTDRAHERAPIDRARERALIDGALQDRNLLPRIRTAVPAGAAAAASSE